MRVWRLAFGRFNHLDGEGARLHGGRWNSVGVPVVYAASHLTLALLEQLVRFESVELPRHYRAFSIHLPEGVEVETVHAAADLVNDTEACRRIGDAWAESLRSVALVIPSVIVPMVLSPGDVPTDERNVILNPRHPRAREWRVVETTFRADPRLSNRPGQADISAGR